MELNSGIWWWHRINFLLSSCTVSYFVLPSAVDGVRTLFFFGYFERKKKRACKWDLS